eukprot:symbB.v1.2.001159.t1/scaffold47.1/size388503/14
MSQPSNQLLEVKREFDSGVAGLNTPVSGLVEEATTTSLRRKTSFDQELQVKRQASFDQVSVKAGSASPVSDKLERPKATASGVFICWLCRRKFDTNEHFDLHVLHSRLHQETIRQLAGRMEVTTVAVMQWPLVEVSEAVETCRSLKPLLVRTCKVWRLGVGTKFTPT